MKFPTIQELKKESFENFQLPPIKPWHRFWKRFFDIIFSLLGLIILSPILLMIAVLIRLTSKGKAIFSHERAGKNDKIFRLYKFRTMYEGVKDQELAPNSPQDPRITRMGKFLRRTSLDEIPQFWNVLRGEMSLVGPRPEMPFIVKNYTALQRKRLLIKPGMTGLWQILGRKDLPLHENIELDFYYIRCQSLFLDFVILFKTIFVVISGKGAY